MIFANHFETAPSFLLRGLTQSEKTDMMNP